MGISNHIFQNYREKILSHLKDSDMSLSDLIVKYFSEEERIKEIIRWMLDNGELILKDDTLLSINQ